MTHISSLASPSVLIPGTRPWSSPRWAGSSRRRRSRPTRCRARTARTLSLQEKTYVMRRGAYCIMHVWRTDQQKDGVREEVGSRGTLHQHFFFNLIILHYSLCSDMFLLETDPTSSLTPSHILGPFVAWSRNARPFRLAIMLYYQIYIQILWV